MHLDNLWNPIEHQDIGQGRMGFVPFSAEYLRAVLSLKRGVYLFSFDFSSRKLSNLFYSLR